MPKPWYVDGRLLDRKEHRSTLTTNECRELLPNLWAAPSLPADHSHWAFPTFKVRRGGQIRYAKLSL
jgi:hypothetical protein